MTILNRQGLYGGRESGVALLLCLVFLTAMTLLGLSASADVILQQQLSSNLRETERAGQAALAALDWAEDWLLQLENPPPGNCTDFCNGVLVHASGSLPAQPGLSSPAWWSENAHVAGYDPMTGRHATSTFPNSGDPSHWAIEVLHESSPDENTTQTWYRILARGTGNNGIAVSVIESVVTRPWTQASHTEPDHPCSDEAMGKACDRLTWRILR